MEDKFIKGGYGSGLSKDARAVHERAKIENLKREINRNDEVTPDKFKGYRDFSSYAPTNDEIVAALPLRHAEDQLAIFTSKGYGKKIPQKKPANRCS